MSSRSPSDLVSALCCGGLAALAVVAMALNSRIRPPRGELLEIPGHLTEWAIDETSRARFLRLKIDSSTADFRLDPGYFREVLDRKVPEGFRRGAPVVIFAKGAAADIVWIRGLTINGRAVIRPESIEAADSRDDLYGYALIAAGMAGFFWFTFRRTRSS